MLFRSKHPGYKPKERTWRLRPELLLCANTVKPMHGVVPRVILGQEWWDKTRKAAYASTDQHCAACGVSRREAKESPWLEGHEVYDVDYLLGRMTYVETVPLCHWCHCYIHDGRLRALLDAGEITAKKFNAVIEHGNAIIKRAGLVKRAYQGPIAEWGDWRLILDGKEYPPLYKDYEEWERAFSNKDEE